MTVWITVVDILTDPSHLSLSLSLATLFQSPQRPLFLSPPPPHLHPLSPPPLPLLQGYVPSRMSAQLGEYEESKAIAETGIPLRRRGAAADMAVSPRS